MPQDQKVTAPSEVSQLQALLGIMGGSGTTSTSAPTNTAPLQGVLANLQGIDYNALLQSIFQQAAGQIPGLQSAYGRTVGARSSGNAPMQAALQDLLRQTTLAGQQQIATQQNQNLQTQTQAASNLRGTRQVAGNKGQLGEAAALIGLLQGATKLGGYKTVQEMLGAVSGLGTQPATTGTATAPELPAYNPAGTNMSMAPSVQPMFDLGQVVSAAPVYDMPAGPQLPTLAEVPTYDYGNMTNIAPEFNVSDYALEPQLKYDMSPADLQEFNVMNYF